MDITKFLRGDFGASPLQLFGRGYDPPIAPMESRLLWSDVTSQQTCRVSDVDSRLQCMWVIYAWWWSATYL